MSNSFSALLLDSGTGWLNKGRESFILFDLPDYSLSSFGDRIIIDINGSTETIIGDPISELQRRLDDGYVALGYIGYEFSKYTNPGLEIRRKDGSDLPDTYFNFYKKSDYETGDISSLEGYKLVEEDLEKFEKRGKQFSNFTRQDYVAMVERAKSYIGAGDICQVNLSQRFKTASIKNPLSAFLNFYTYQPVPFGAYINFGKIKVISGSMELFLEKIGSKIVSKPIKGTAKRDKNVDIDMLNKKNLFASEKERAENLMIVDLMRNDIGRISEIGSVRVNNLFKINSYSTLYQMESEIEGKLKGGKELTEIINATFPPGSVTGAPKSRALEIINELEPHYRGPYCGALGLFCPNGDFKLSVAIRVLLTDEKESSYWVGAGIVWDSIPKEEYLETLLKARAIQKSIFV